MDPELFKRLNLPIGSITVVEVNISTWGRNLSLYCWYSFPSQEYPFILRFEECTRILWNADDRTDYREIMADTIDIILREDQQPKEAIIITDVFEIVVNYGKLLILRDVSSKS